MYPYLNPTFLEIVNSYMKSTPQLLEIANNYFNHCFQTWKYVCLSKDIEEWKYLHTQLDRLRFLTPGFYPDSTLELE